MLPPDAISVIWSVVLGVSLAAACGFRVFVPFLVISIAAFTGKVQLAENFQWLATWPALVAFGAATALEITAYYVPWLDHLLDTIATPVAVVAGVIVTAACITDMDPLLKWTLAVIAGGGAAATVQGLTVVTRAASTATTGGLGNPVVATGEAAGSTTMSLLAIFAPFVAALALMVAVVLMVMLLRRLVRRRRQRQPLPA